MNGKHELLTQSYSTFGDKLLCHTDVLFDLQHNTTVRPITVQLAPCEPCESDCPFCSVSERPLSSVMPWKRIVHTINQFAELGAKSIEITGGGNPMLYSDNGYTINDIVKLAASVGLAVGIITNSHDFKQLDRDVYGLIDWIRVSLIKLDEGKEPEQYNFRDFPEHKIGFSYIIYSQCDGTPRTRKQSSGTTTESIVKIAELVKLHPKIKFVRIAGDCLIKGNNASVKKEMTGVIDKIDEYGKFFIKDIDENDSPYDEECYVGLVRPYVAPSPEGDDYLVYICTSHVLNKRTYDRNYALCNVDRIKETWSRMQSLLQEGRPPYSVAGNNGKQWCQTCTHCFYANNNRLLDVVVNGLPDGEFA